MESDQEEGSLNFIQIYGILEELNVSRKEREREDLLARYNIVKDYVKVCLERWGYSNPLETTEEDTDVLEELERVGWIIWEYIEHISWVAEGKRFQRLSEATNTLMVVKYSQKIKRVKAKMDRDDVYGFDPVPHFLGQMGYLFGSLEKLQGDQSPLFRKEINRFRKQACDILWAIIQLKWRTDRANLLIKLRNRDEPVIEIERSMEQHEEEQREKEQKEEEQRGEEDKKKKDQKEEQPDEEDEEDDKTTSNSMDKILMVYKKFIRHLQIMAEDREKDHQKWIFHLTWGYELLDSLLRTILGIQFEIKLSKYDEKKGKGKVIKDKENEKDYCSIVQSFMFQLLQSYRGLDAPEFSIIWKKNCTQQESSLCVKKLDQCWNEFKMKEVELRGLKMEGEDSD